MAETERQKQHAQDIHSERWISQRWNVSREEARQRLNEFRNTQAEAAAKKKATTMEQTSSPATPPKPTMQTQTTSFQPRPFTIGDTQIPFQPVTPTPGGGYTGNITVCVDDGMGGFTNGTAMFSGGKLVSVTT